MLTSAREQYRRQQRINALALRQARRSAARGAAAVTAVVLAYQAEAVANSFDSAPEILAEQGILAPVAGTASVSALLTAPDAAAAMLAKAANSDAFDRLVLTLVQDAGRTAAAVDIGRRPAITGHVRSLNLPSCSRCAILAGRVYRYSTGFRRHPNCDCLMTPTTLQAGRDLVLDPTDAIGRGQVLGLSRGDIEALDMGADLGQVVNVRRTQAGLTVGSSVVERGGRATPQGILLASDGDRDRAISLLRRHGYIT